MATKDELKERAEKLGVENVSTLNKPELEEAILAKETEHGVSSDATVPGAVVTDGEAEELSELSGRDKDNKGRNAEEAREAYLEQLREDGVLPGGEDDDDEDEEG